MKYVLVTLRRFSLYEDDEVMKQDQTIRSVAFSCSIEKRFLLFIP